MNNMSNKIMYTVFSLAKAHMIPFVSKHVGAYSPFDLLYLDLWISPVLDTTGARYFFLIVDDFSSYIWIYFFKLKIRLTLCFNRSWLSLRKTLITKYMLFS